MNHRHAAPIAPRHDTAAQHWIVLPALAWLLAALLVFSLSYTMRYADEAAAAEPPADAVPATVFHGA